MESEQHIIEMAKDRLPDPKNYQEDTFEVIIEDVAQKHHFIYEKENEEWILKDNWVESLLTWKRIG